jgi:hypothetical protein
MYLFSQWLKAKLTGKNSRCRAPDIGANLWVVVKKSPMEKLIEHLQTKRTDPETTIRIAVSPVISFASSSAPQRKILLAASP